MSKVNNDTADFTLDIPQPSPYFSQEDENHFFEWLKSIRSIKGMTGYTGGLILKLEDAILNDQDLLELIALMSRYQLDLSSLQCQCTSENEYWLKNPKKFWYRKMFGRKEGAAEHELK